MATRARRDAPSTCRRRTGVRRVASGVLAAALAWGAPAVAAPPEPVAALAPPGRAAVEAAPESAARRLARAARRACEDGEGPVSREERARRFEHGRRLAEQAVALDDGDAEARFALFCNSAQLLKLSRNPFRTIFRLRAVLADLDRTLALDPHHVDARTSKGMILLQLPRFLGGDVQRGLGFLEDVVRDDPTAMTARLELAAACEQRGDRARALALTREARTLAHESGHPLRIAKADAMMSRIGGDGGR